jgi:hypothetical protein
MRVTALPVLLDEEAKYVHKHRRRLVREADRHVEATHRRYRELIGYEPERGVPLPATLRTLGLPELVPIAERIGAQALAAAG